MRHTKKTLEVRRRVVEGFTNGYVILNQEIGEDNADLFRHAPDMFIVLDELVERLQHVTNKDIFIKQLDEAQALLIKLKGY